VNVEYTVITEESLTMNQLLSLTILVVFCTVAVNSKKGDSTCKDKYGLSGCRRNMFNVGCNSTLYKPFMTSECALTCGVCYDDCTDPKYACMSAIGQCPKKYGDWAYTGYEAKQLGCDGVCCKKNELKKRGVTYYFMGRAIYTRRRTWRRRG